MEEMESSGGDQPSRLRKGSRPGWKQVTAADRAVPGQNVNFTANWTTR